MAPYEASEGKATWRTERIIGAPRCVIVARARRSSARRAAVPAWNVAWPSVPPPRRRCSHVPTERAGAGAGRPTDAACWHHHRGRVGSEKFHLGALGSFGCRARKHGHEARRPRNIARRKPSMASQQRGHEVGAGNRTCRALEATEHPDPANARGLAKWNGGLRADRVGQQQLARRMHRVFLVESDAQDVERSHARRVALTQRQEGSDFGTGTLEIREAANDQYGRGGLGGHVCIPVAAEAACAPRVRTPVDRARTHDGHRTRDGDDLCRNCPGADRAGKSVYSW